MADTYIVKTKYVKVSIGPAGGNKVARILRAGQVLPDGVSDVHMKALLDAKLISKVNSRSTPKASTPAGTGAGGTGQAAAPTSDQGGDPAVQASGPVPAGDQDGTTAAQPKAAQKK